MLKRELSTVYGKNNVIGIEVNKNDFQIFNDEHMISVKQTELPSFEGYTLKDAEARRKIF